MTENPPKLMPYPKYQIQEIQKWTDNAKEVNFEL